MEWHETRCCGQTRAGMKAVPNAKIDRRPGAPSPNSIGPLDRIGRLGFGPGALCGAEAKPWRNEYVRPAQCATRHPTGAIATDRRGQRVGRDIRGTVRRSGRRRILSGAAPAPPQRLVQRIPAHTMGGGSGRCRTSVSRPAWNQLLNRTGCGREVDPPIGEQPYLTGRRGSSRVAR